MAIPESGIKMKLTIEEANKKIHELIEGLLPFEGAYQFHTSLEDSELILKDIEESGIQYEESFNLQAGATMDGDRHYALRMMVKNPKPMKMIQKYHANKLINRMQAFLSWKFGEKVEIV